MIGVKEAINKVINSTVRLKVVNLGLLNALNHCLAEDVYSTMNMPPFSQSAMDGYAICGEGRDYVLVGEVKAGDTLSCSLNKGEAFRIFTGGMIPVGTTAIAKQEIVINSGKSISIQEDVKLGTSIRKKGEELLKDQLVMKKGTLITPAAIGLLSGLGFVTVNVIQQPKITLVVTGNELTKLGDELLPGKIYESNSYTLKSALLGAGYSSEVVLVKDDYEQTKNVIEEAILNSDLVIMTGGISVGDYDFVGKALAEIGVNQEFYKVKQKPGKPLFYGEKGNVKVFALPGNPAAALTCFYVYVLTAIKEMMGNDNSTLQSRTVAISHDYTKKGDRVHLLKAQVKNGKVTVHSGQSSAMLSSFVDANCLLYLDSEVRDVKSGSEVEVFMLP